jgi:hypothetical protein
VREHPADCSGFALHRAEVVLAEASTERQSGHQVMEHEVVEDHDARPPPKRVDDPAVRGRVVADVVEGDVRRPARPAPRARSHDVDRETPFQRREFYPRALVDGQELGDGLPGRARRRLARLLVSRGEREEAELERLIRSQPAVTRPNTVAVISPTRGVGKTTSAFVVGNALADRLRLHSSYTDDALGRDVEYRVTGSKLGLALMYVAGVVSGLLGIGSGALKVPAMDLAMRLPIKVSTATSNFMIGVTAAASAGVYLKHGYLDPGLAMPVVLGVLTGSTLGTRVLAVAPPRSLRLVFGLVIVALAVQMIVRGVRGGL